MITISLCTDFPLHRFYSYITYELFNLSSVLQNLFVELHCPWSSLQLSQETFFAIPITLNQVLKASDLDIYFSIIQVMTWWLSPWKWISM